MPLMRKYQGGMFYENITKKKESRYYTDLDAMHARVNLK